MADVLDGYVSFQGGQNDGLAPNRISKAQYARGINVTTKKGNLGPRPGFIHQQIKVTTEGRVGGKTYAQIFESGKFQAAASYDTDEGVFILAVFSGIIFRISPRTLEADVIPIGEEGDRMNQYRTRIPWSYAGRFFVFFDYPNAVVIVENHTARRSSRDRESLPGVTLPEVPDSVLGTNINNRLWVANAVHEFGASDPEGGINEDAPITFEESLAPFGAYVGQFFSLGVRSSNQPITAMGTMQVPDSSTGFGPLVIATRKNISTGRADLERADWDDTTFKKVALYGAGIPSPRGLVNVNSDLMFVSDDSQVRSLLIGQASQQRYSNAPISREVSGIIEEYKDDALVEISFAGTFRNRVFFSVAPFATICFDLFNRRTVDYAHRAILVLELDNVAALGQEAAPAWAGMWTGISPMEIVSLDDAAYFFSKDDGGTNRLYKMDENISWDTFEDEEVPITSRFYTRDFDFDAPFLDKKIGTVNYALNSLSGDIEMKVEYRTNRFDRWATWKNLCYKAQTENCDCPEMLQEHAFDELDFGDPEEPECDPITEDQGQYCKYLQLCVTIKAKDWSLESIKLRFETVNDTRSPTEAACCDEKPKKVIDECDRLSDWDVHYTAPTLEGQGEILCQ